MLSVESLKYKKFLRDINFELSAGKLYGLIGLNGSGKSTLLKLLSGLWPACSGSIYYEGLALASMAPHEIAKIIALIPQNPHFPFNYSVEDIVKMGRYVRGVNAAIVEKAMKKLDVWKLKKRSILELSAGEQQRTIIARALCSEAPILLLDEPTASLDPLQEFKFWEIMLELKKNDKLLLIATHNLKKLSEHADQILLLKNQKLQDIQTLSKENLENILINILN